jgi:hypothetical protein
MSYYTYAHFTKDTNELFYIGKGSFTKQGDFKRATACTGRNAFWKNKVNKHNGFKVEILAVWNTEQEAFAHEEFLISVMKEKLVNLTFGGEGCSGRVQSKAEKDKRANSHRGQKRSLESLANMSKAQKNNNVSLAVLAQAREKQKKQILCVDTGVVYNSLTEAGLLSGVSFQNISKACKGIRQHAGGYKWKFIDGKS